MDDLATLDHDLHVVAGDLVQGHASFYPLYRSLILERARRPVRSLSGNGDVGAGLDHYYAATGFPDIHDHYLRGVRFIYLGTTSMSPLPPGGYHICHLGDAQLHALAQMLSEDLHTTTVVFGHAPLKDTTYRSSFEPGLNEMWLHESEALQRLFAAHPNVVFYGSGHVHYDYGRVDSLGQDGWYLDRARGVVHHAIGDSCTGHGSTMMEIGEAGITLKVRDHRDGAGVWRHDMERAYAVPTTLV